MVKRLRRKLGDDANSPRYVITEPRVGYRMAVGEAKAEGTDRNPLSAERPYPLIMYGGGCDRGTS